MPASPLQIEVLTRHKEILGSRPQGRQLRAEATR
jgi:hypothetical protein